MRQKIVPERTPDDMKVTADARFLFPACRRIGQASSFREWIRDAARGLNPCCEGAWKTGAAATSHA